MRTRISVIIVGALSAVTLTLLVRGKVVDTAIGNRVGDARFEAGGTAVPPVIAGNPTRVVTAAGGLAPSGHFG